MSTENSIGLKDLKVLYQHMNEGVCLHEVVYDDKGTPIDYRIVDVNPSYEAITNIPKEEAVGALGSEVYKVGEPPYLELFTGVAETGNPAEVEIFWPPMQKHFRIAIISPQRGRFFTIFFDISDVKNAVEKREKSEAKYLDLFTRYPIGLVISQVKDGTVINCNEYIATMLGYPDKESCIAEYSSQKHYAHAEDREKMIELLRSNGKIENYEVELIDCNNKHFWVLYSARIDGDIIEGAALDITSKKAIERSLLESEERYCRLANATHEAIAISKAGKIIDVSKQIEEIYGYTPEEVKEIGLEKLIHPDDLEYVQENIKEFYQGPYRHKGISKDGKTIHLEIRADTIQIQGEEHRLTVIRDITDLMSMQDSLFQSEKMRAIGQLAGGIAHDFNNQLAGIVGFADVLREKLTYDSELAYFAESILLTSQRAADLTSQLLAFARKGKYLTVAIDLHKIIMEVVNILNRTIDKKIAIKKSFKAEYPLTKGDPTQIQNAIMNIALNSRDAMPNGGELIFSTSIVSLDETYCTKTPYEIIPGDYILLCITDSGIGIEHSMQKKIFEPFFTTKDQGKGAGMGLASVYGTIKNHGGAVNVYSEPGHGTTMKLYFPVNDSKKQVQLQEHKESPPITSDAFILIVDDEQVVLDSTAKMLEITGFKTAKCRTGKEAIDFYQCHWKEIDLVILDMVMPEYSGKETFLALKDINPDILVLLSSGYSLNGEANTILKEGVKGFIQKPHKRLALSQKIIEILRKQGK